ncbi:restriction endonuclease [uncultured Clostridium sp.]|uniref:restriction endonuclease n=1 Tax=uncultured Clostridium sp. TaxID=59620 RepID=UPI0026171C58|nr:restriction endonuclease [uncultured Clostridium sp.]
MEELNEVKKMLVSIVTGVCTIVILLILIGVKAEVIIYIVVWLLCGISLILTKKIFDNIKEKYLIYKEEILRQEKIEEINKLTNEEFSRYIEEKFIKEGYVTKNLITYKNKIELLLEKNTIQTIVYGIKTEKDVNAHEVYKIIKLKEKYNVKFGMIVATSKFTDSVHEMTKNKGVKLINIYKLINHDVEKNEKYNL